MHSKWFKPLVILWLILIKQVVFEFYMLQHEIVQFYAALQHRAKAKLRESRETHKKYPHSLLFIIERYELKYCIEKE